MTEIKVVRLEDTEIVKFGPDAFYQPILGDDEGTTPIRTGIQTSEPGYVAPVHSHPYLEVLHILEGTAEAWVDGQEADKVTLAQGRHHRAARECPTQLPGGRRRGAPPPGNARLADADRQLQGPGPEVRRERLSAHPRLSP